MGYNNDLLTGKVIGAAIEVHTALGPGLLETAYRKCLAFELSQKGLYVQTEVELPINYKEVEIKPAYRIDILVNNELVVELKAVEALNDVHLAQVLTYLRFGKYHKGLLLNFNVKRMRDGIRRVVL